MLKFKNNRYLLLLQDEFRRIVTEEHPELIKDGETLTKIDITKDRLSRYLSSKDEEISIEIRTALNLCNYLNVPPYAIFATDGSLSHTVDVINPEKEPSHVSVPCNDLRLSDRLDDALRMASAGLEKSEGSPERVSNAIACITGYLRSIIHRAPELKNNSQGLVDAITATLASATLDPDHTSMEDLCSVIKNGIAELKELDQLPKQAKQEADEIISRLQVARLDSDDVQRLRAIKAALFWLHDYWVSICMEQSAYNALSGVSCAMASAPTDYSIRSRLVAHVNSFAAYVAMYDPVYREMHKGEQNE